jgi:hypothetical protein
MIGQMIGMAGLADEGYDRIASALPAGCIASTSRTRNFSETSAA